MKEQYKISNKEHKIREINRLSFNDVRFDPL